MNALEPEFETEAERRKRSKKAYEAVVRCVDLNSGHKQPPLAKWPSVLGSLHGGGYGRYGLDELYRARNAARANGDLFVARDAAGDRRVGIDDEQRLLEKIATHVSAVDEPRRREDVIGLANERIQTLRERGRDE